MKPINALLSITTVLALTLSAACSSTGSLPGNMVARVNGEGISRQMFDQQYSRVIGSMKLDTKQLNDEKTKPLVQMFQKVVIQNLIFDRLIQSEAQKRKLSVTPDELKAVYDEQIKQIGGETALNDQLKQLKMSSADFRNEIERQLLRDKLVQALAGSQLKVSDSEINSFYQAHKAQFNEPEQVRARHILIGADPKQLEKDIKAKNKGINATDLQVKIQTEMDMRRHEADKLLTQAKNAPDSFASLAMAHSDDTGSAKNGGDLGYFASEVMVPEFSKAAFSTKPGTVHDKVVQSPFGFHIIQVVDRKAPQQKGLSDVKGQLVTMLENQKKSQFLEGWLTDAKKKAKIELAPAFAFVKDNAELAPPVDGNKAPVKQGG